ncbi:MAG TPA: M28 family peptidase, partial [Bdellovibrionota bacterium]|nr:M28 family peptidase [Bdellovibrionota bacterium]
HALSLPPRLWGRSVVWIAREDHGRWRLVSGPKVEWVDDAAIPPVPATVDGAVTGDWSAPGAFEAFRDAYREDVRIVAGEREALFPVSGRRVTFARKNCALVDHDLEDAADYLAERYAALGISTFRQRFTWRGLPQSNLVAVLPATLPGGSGRPLLLADHYDTAFAEDVYAATGKRVAVPGADDNGSATAALLRAASLLRDVPRREPIWLTHLTGEEYPADDLGARELVSWLKRTHWSVRGFWVMDMIGWRAEGDRLVQISAGDGAEAMAFAAGVRDAFTRVAPGLLPVIRQSNDERAYLYNTDGLVFSEAGWPALLVNEHLNALENLERPDYHHTTDLSGIMDMDFAARVALAVIDAAAAVSR